MTDLASKPEPANDTVTTTGSTAETRPVAPVENKDGQESQTAPTLVEDVDKQPSATVHADSSPSEAHDTLQVQEETELKAKDEIRKPITAGILAYRTGHAALPIFRKRHFFFKDEPTPLESLRALYHKFLKNKTTEREDLHELIAYASVTGRGLLFWSKDAFSEPAGILACSSVIEVVADEKHSERFHVSCRKNVSYIFETKEIARDEWISAILLRRGDFNNEYAKVTSSDTYLANLKALHDGVAYNKALAEMSSDSSSDEEGAAAVASATEPKADQPKVKRTSAFFSAFKDKIQQDNANAESGGNKTPKKDKRKSFLQNLMAKKDAGKEQGIEKSPPSATGPLEQSTTVSAPSADVPIAHEPSITNKLEAKVEEDARAPDSAKKADGFFGKMFGKAAEKDDKSGAAGSPKDGVSVSNGSPIQTQHSLEGSTVETAEAGSTKIDSRETQVSSLEIVEPVAQKDVLTESAKEVSHEPSATSSDTLQAPEKDNQRSPGNDKARRPNSIARRLTAIFRQKKHEKVVESDGSQDHATISNSEAPKLPEPSRSEEEPLQSLRDQEALERNSPAMGPEHVNDAEVSKVNNAVSAA